MVNINRINVTGSRIAEGGGDETILNTTIIGVIPLSIGSDNQLYELRTAAPLLEVGPGFNDVDIRANVNGTITASQPALVDIEVIVVQQSVIGITEVIARQRNVNVSAIPVGVSLFGRFLKGEIANASYQLRLNVISRNVPINDLFFGISLIPPQSGVTMIVRPDNG